MNDLTDDGERELGECIELAQRIFGSDVGVVVDLVAGGRLYQAEVTREPSVFIEEGQTPLSSDALLRRAADSKLKALSQLRDALKGKLPRK